MIILLFKYDKIKKEFLMKMYQSGIINKKVRMFVHYLFKKDKNFYI